MPGRMLFNSGSVTVEPESWLPAKLTATGGSVPFFARTGLVDQSDNNGVFVRRS